VAPTVSQPLVGAPLGENTVSGGGGFVKRRQGKRVLFLKKRTKKLLFVAKVFCFFSSEKKAFL
jgi:hypothetical protein